MQNLKHDPKVAASGSQLARVNEDIESNTIAILKGERGAFGRASDLAKIRERLLTPRRLRHPREKVA
jgi:hypothetical protein